MAQDTQPTSEQVFQKRHMRNLLLTGCTVILFFVLTMVTVMKHEMWRDEMQDWLIAQNSDYVIDLICHLRYEGHPGLWHLSLYFLGKLVAQPLIMQIFHVTVATITVFVVIQYAPFTFLQKILFVFGYFLCYEYAVISRNYVLQMLFLFVCCALYPTRKRNYLWLAICLFLLCQTNIFGLIMAFSFWGIMLVEYVIDKSFRELFLERKTDILVGTLIVLFGIGVSIVQVMQPADSGFAMGWKTDFDIQTLSQTITTIWNGFVPIPQNKMEFWNSNIADNYFTVKLVLSGLIFGLCCLSLSQKPLSLLLFLISTIGILTLFYTKYIGYLRHHGQAFIIFMCCLWLSVYQKPIKKLHISSFSKYIKTYQEVFILTILPLHLIAGIIAIAFDWQYPFSASKAVAKYIQEHHLSQHLLVGEADYTASAVAGYLGKVFYYPTGNRFGTFIIWDKKRRERLPPQVVFDRAMYVADQTGKDVVFVLNYPVTTDSDIVQYLGQFTTSIEASERYFLYLVRTNSKR